MKHTPVLHSPWYADPADGTLLHRYLDEEFVPRFLQEAQSGRLKRNADQTWRAEDRFASRFDYPTLRLPVHRAFYIASCEVSCDTFGLPALDPARVLSAGMVVRRGRSNSNALRWMIKEGVPTGWWPGDGTSEPCDCRRLRQLGVLPERFPEPPFSGEETYPMHPLFLHAKGSDGVNRSHTLLWGYVPLGGQVRVDGAPTAINVAQPDYTREHRWPFGSADGVQGWQRGMGYQVRAGRVEAPLRQLLHTLLGRYRINDPTDPNNAALRQVLAGIHFQTSPLMLRRSQGMLLLESEPVFIRGKQVFSAIRNSDLDDSGDPGLASERQQISLLAYLDRRAEQVLEWLSWQERGEDSALPAFALSASEPPASETSLPRLDWSLYVTEAQAEALRDLQEIRARATLEASDAGTAVPRFNQDDDDVFFTLPFLRYHDEKGCERVVWGPASQPFRVASPLSPQAQRPSLIVLPGLSELKLGAPRGLTFIAPKSLADKILKLKFDMDMKTDGPGNPGGSCFGFSFSLPIITLCALILLMIIISLLNLIFFWLPFAFLAIPRLCLRAIAKRSPGAAGGGGG
jgi:hypothetical protein